MRTKFLVAGLLAAALFPLVLTPESEAQVLPVPLPSVGVDLPRVPAPIASRVPVPLPTRVEVPPRRPGLPLPVLTPVPGPTTIVTRPSPVPVPGPTETVTVREDGVRVITRTVPGPVRTVPGPVRVVTVPGPVRTVVSEKFTPGQERVVEKRVEQARFRAGIAGVIAGFLIAFTIACLIAYRFYRQGEIAGLRILRDTI